MIFRIRIVCGPGYRCSNGGGRRLTPGVVTFDVYIPRTQSKVWLIDINPWAERTDPLLFSWLELLRLDAKKVEVPELRIVNKDDPEAYCFNTPQYSAHKLPKEVCGLS